MNDLSDHLHHTLAESVRERPGIGTIGIAADHGGFQLKTLIARQLRDANCQVIDFGSRQLTPDDDYTDYVIPLARSVSEGSMVRGIAICGSGVGATVAANKIHGIRACLITDPYSAHQGVEHDDMNLICLGGLVVGNSLAWELIQAFLMAQFNGEDRHRRRLSKINVLETSGITTKD